MKRPRRATKKTVRKAARKTTKRAIRKRRSVRAEPGALTPSRKVDPYHISDRLIPAGWAYQWKVKGADVPPGWHCVPYSRHAHDFPRSANYQGAIVIKGLTLMEALKDQVVSELHVPSQRALDMERDLREQFGMDGPRAPYNARAAMGMLRDDQIVTKVLKDAPPETGPDIDVPISLLIRVPARWAAAAAYLNLTIAEYARRRVVAERMILGSMDERSGDLNAIYQPVNLKFSPSKEV